MTMTEIQKILSEAAQRWEPDFPADVIEDQQYPKEHAEYGAAEH
jgi:hypothetical protein